MKPGHLLAIARSALCACVFACAALVVDYQNVLNPAFCAADSSCNQVRISPVGKYLADSLNAAVPGLLLPQLALFIFLGLLGFTFFVKTRAHLGWLALLSGVGAAFAGFLVVAQIRMKLFCTYCMVVDVAMIVAAGAAIALFVVASRRARLAAGSKGSGGKDEELERTIDRATDTRATIGWGIAGALLTAIPFIWARFPAEPPLPPELAGLQQPGKSVVIVFTDFQCPFCRKLHVDTKEALHQPNVVVERKMVALPSHTGALPAALAYVCTPPERQDEVAHALYTVEPSELTYEGVRKILAELEVADEESVVACLRSPETLARTEADKKLFFDQLGGAGLPTTYVGGRVIKGADPARVIASVGQSGGGFYLPVWLMFVLSGVVLVGVVVSTELRPMPAPRSPTPAPADDDDDDDDDGDEKEEEGPPPSEDAPEEEKPPRSA